MRNLSSVKQEFLQKWITGLRRYNSQKKNMTLLERKKAIKLSADLAMASTRNETTLWSRAIIANANSRNVNDDRSNNNMVKVGENLMNSSSLICSRSKIIKRRKIARRSCAVIHRSKKRVMANSNSIAKRLVQKRTRRLKSLLPGGQFMDDVALVEETLDYIQSLRAQVEVMRSLVTASDLITNPS